MLAVASSLSWLLWSQARRGFSPMQVHCLRLAFRPSPHLHKPPPPRAFGLGRTLLTHAVFHGNGTLVRKLADHTAGVALNSHMVKQPPLGCIAYGMLLRDAGGRRARPCPPTAEPDIMADLLTLALKLHPMLACRSSSVALVRHPTSWQPSRPHTPSCSQTRSTSWISTSTHTHLDPAANTRP